MRKSYLLALLFLSSQTVFCQNLVSNPSFETYNACPTGLGQIDFSPTYSSFPTAADWVIPINSSSDYFNTCAFTSVSIPSNTFGTQTPHSGNAYAGIYLYSGDSSMKGRYKEYVETKLTSPLTAGTYYYTQFYVSLAETNFSAQAVAMDKIGAYFSDTLFYSGGFNLYLTNVPQVSNTPGRFITDTAKWVKIDGIYKAKGGEQWITIGSFIDTLVPQSYLPVRGYPFTSYSVVCYEYVDDVSVTTINNTNITQTRICTSTFPLTLNGGAKPGRYLWNTGDTTATITVNGPGEYVRNTIIDSISSYVDVLNVYKQNNITGIDTIICADRLPITLTGSTVTGNHIWNTGSTAADITVSKPGKYWRTTTKTTEYCTTYTDTFAVHKKVTPYLGKDSLYCYGTVVTLATDSTLGGYTWNTGDTTYKISVTEPGQYILSLSSDCPNNTDTINIDFDKILITGTAATDATCYGAANGSITVTASGNYPPFAYSLNHQTAQGAGLFGQLPAGQYKIVVSDDKHCRTDVTLAINQPDAFAVNMVSTPASCEGDTKGSIKAVVSGAVPPYTYQWLTETGETSPDIVATPKREYVLVVTDAQNCTDTIHTATGYDNCCTPFVPNVFTPNGDHTNDELRIKYKGDLKLEHFYIYNRYGQRIFITSNILEGWNGTYNGTPQDMGTYFYYLKAYCGNEGNKEIEMKGDIILMR